MDKIDRYKVYDSWGNRDLRLHPSGQWCKSSDVEVLESELKSLKCCGNCKDYMTNSENCLYNWPNGDGCDNWVKNDSSQS